jgi:uncharacterized protein YlxW (UPF0749 family)
MPPHQDANDIAELVKGFKKEVQDLKGRCNALEQTIENLKSICNTHENTLESHWKEIIGFKKIQGTLNTDFQGEQFSHMHL